MACFLVPAAEAAVMTVVKKAAEKKEKNTQSAEDTEVRVHAKAPGIPFSRKLKWLTSMLWGGTVLLALEHLWHGEIAPYFPFLTAMSSSADTVSMLHEMATTGVMMAVFVTAVWAVMAVVSDRIVRRAVTEETAR
jgi:hypothetical protein